MLGKTSISDLSEHVFDLILELYNIDSHLLLSVLPQLEFKLKVNSSYSFCVFESCAPWLLMISLLTSSSSCLTYKTDAYM